MRNRDEEEVKFWNGISVGGKPAVGMPLGGGISYLLRDDFTDTVAAGSVNGTYSTDGVNLRTATDANSKLSVGSGVFAAATGGIANNGLWYPSFVRAAGQMLIAQITPSDGIPVIGWDDDTAGGIRDCIQFMHTTSVVRVIGSGGGNIVVADSYTPGQPYHVAIVQRGLGHHYFIKSAGGFVKLLYSTKVSNTSVRPSYVIGDGVTIFTSDFMRVPQELIPIIPLASDGFGGAWGTTGGAGSEEAGGTGKTWTAQKGTWGSAAGVAACSELADSLGIATVPCGTPNVMVELVPTRTGGNSGAVLRWTDINNYIHASLDGTNLVVTEVVAGTPNTLATTAVTYGATKRLVLSLNATKIRVYYGDALVGAELTTAVTTGNSHGLYTTDIGATFDNFVVWAQGNGGEYSTLNRFLA